MPSCCASCCSCCSNAVVGTCASIYLIIGVTLVAAGGAALVTPYGQIVTPLVAVLTMLGGAATFVVACIGLCAACENQQRVRSLHIFTLLTLAMVVLSVAAVVLLFQYESVLVLASEAGVEGGVANASAEIVEARTRVIDGLATSAFYKCGAMVNATAGGALTFTCRDESFAMLAQAVNDTCFAPASLTSLNVSAGSVFASCYAGATFPSWHGEDASGRAIGLSSSPSAVLNTPKGIFCACSTTLVNLILPYLRWTKYAAIAVVLFFLLVLSACLHQIKQRGCCGRKGLSEDGVQLQPGSQQGAPSINQTFDSEAAKKGAHKSAKLARNESGYLMRP